MPVATNGTRQTAGGNGSRPAAPRELGPAKDPHLGLRFWVQMDGIEIAGFSECSAPTVETEVFEYTEGGLNTHTHKLPVRTKYGNITLKRGIDVGQDLYRWYESSVDARAKRKNVSILVYGPMPGQRPVKRYNLRRAWPVKWSGPDLKSDAGAVAVETIELAHEGFTVSNE